jgi:UDP-N-acetylmuramoyl-L-alanyl-D-glutamate--2,6-diaminopimelate ligase
VRLAELLKGLDIVQVDGDTAVDIADVCYDSRKCRRASLFVAVPGLKVDGHDYIAQALGLGAAAVVLEKSRPVPPGVAVVRVPDSRRSLGLLGKNLYGNPSHGMCVVGVTGTSGKTTITYLLESILNAAGWTTGVLGTVNYRFGGKTVPAPNTTPESLELQRILREVADAGVRNVVMEVSSHALELRRVDDCEFDIGIFTNLSQEHLDYHSTMEDYFLAKRRFFDTLLDGRKDGRKYRMIVNTDDPWGERLLSEVPGKVLTFAMGKRADVSAGKTSFSVEGIKAEIRTPGGALSIATSLIGGFNLSNILAAAAAAYALDVPASAIRDGVENLKTIPGRLEKVAGLEGPSVFVDYAHKEAALRGVLENLSPFKKGRLITVFGCGGDRDRQKRPLMGKAAVTFSDLTILTSDNPRSEEPMEIIREIEKGINSGIARKLETDDLSDRREKGYLIVPDRRAAIELAIGVADRDDMVLIAGKGHETYQIIGSRTVPFDDRKVAGEALAARGH